MSADRHQPFRRAPGRAHGWAAGRRPRRASSSATWPTARAVARSPRSTRPTASACGRSRTPEPPRDLWARTSAALDREVADEADALLSPGFGGSRGPRQFRVAIGSLVAAMLILALTGGQLLPGAPTPGLPTATPFAIPAEAVSYVGVTNGQLTFYRASVGEVCPPPRLDCADGPDGEAVVRFASGVHAREMTLSRSGQLFVSGSDELGEEIFAIVTLPAPEPPSGSAGSEPPSPCAGRDVDLGSGGQRGPRRDAQPRPRAGRPADAAADRRTRHPAQPIDRSGGRSFGRAVDLATTGCRRPPWPRPSPSSRTPWRLARPLPGRRMAPRSRSAPCRPITARDRTSTSGDPATSRPTP